MKKIVCMLLIISILLCGTVVADDDGYYTIDELLAMGYILYDVDYGVAPCMEAPEVDRGGPVPEPCEEHFYRLESPPENDTFRYVCYDNDPIVHIMYDIVLFVCENCEHTIEGNNNPREEEHWFYNATDEHLFGTDMHRKTGVCYWCEYSYDIEYPCLTPDMCTALH